MIGTAYCSIAVIQSVLLSGGTFNRLSEFGEFTCEISFVKVTKDNNKRVWVCALHAQYLFSKCTLCVLHVCLRWNIHTDQYERNELSWGVKRLTVNEKLLKIRRTVLLNHCHIITPSTVSIKTDSSTFRLS